MQALAIMYHDVVENGDFESSGFPGEGAHVYKLRSEDFERHLDAIAAATAAVSGRWPYIHWRLGTGSGRGWRFPAKSK